MGRAVYRRRLAEWSSGPASLQFTVAGKSGVAECLNRVGDCDVMELWGGAQERAQRERPAPSPAAG